MDAQQAQMVAKFLGEPYCVNDAYPDHVGKRCDKSTWIYALSDADLLMALLTKAAEIGLRPWITEGLRDPNEPRWRATFWRSRPEKYEGEQCWEALSGSGDTPLAALIAAVVAYVREKEAT